VALTVPIWLHASSREVETKNVGRLALLATWALCGCVHTGFVPTSDLLLPARPEHCALDVVLDGRPVQPYVVIGRVSVDSTAPGPFAWGENQSVVLRRLESKACAVGAHVIFDVKAATSGSWDDDGFPRSTTGSALAAVYVDEDGHPLPPPGATVADY
jgi:hypothetical protein